jgi:hypothetical protein
LFDFRYYDNVEVFCPNDACSQAPFAALPFGITGSVGAFSKGVAFICGGARTFYRDCAAKNSANFCARNAECVTTAGGALWCTGPKIASCFVYDRYLTKSWIASPLGLLYARAHAASVVLPDGRVWVLGGVGSAKVLQTTEIIETDETGIAKIYQGADLPEPLIGHCAAVLSTAQVMVIGGYSTVQNDYSATAFVYDFGANQWSQNVGAGARMDASCLNVNFGGLQTVLVAGGWNNLALSDTAVYNATDSKWIFLNGTGSLSTGSPSSPLPAPLRSSALIERSQSSILLGGVSCDADGRSCRQSDAGEDISHFTFFTSHR